MSVRGDSNPCPLTMLGNYGVHPHPIGLGNFQWLRVSIRQPGVMELKYSLKLTVARRNLRLSASSGHSGLAKP